MLRELKSLSVWMFGTALAVGVQRNIRVRILIVENTLRGRSALPRPPKGAQTKGPRHPLLGLRC